MRALLADESIAVSSRDIVAPALGSELKDGEQVVVRYARPFTVNVDGVTHTYWTTALTVEPRSRRSASAPTAPGSPRPGPCRSAGRA